ncbi:MAG TPA: EamA family transporter [Thermoanaerobaculia bacterium]|nr:EamA family transporter [Thermoanaerobaculia bacterium]
MRDEARDRLLMIVSFLAIHVVWGSTYLAIRYAVETIPPLLTAGLRHLFGGIALFAWCWSRGFRPTKTQWKASLILSLMFFLIGHGSLHWAETVVPSGVAALLVSTEPVWIAALMALFGDRSRLSPYGIGGLLLGIAAVAILVEPPSSAGSALFLGSIVLVVGSLGWALGMMYARTAPLHPAAIMSASMTLICGGVSLLVASALTGSLAHFEVRAVTTRSVLGLLYLLVFGSLTFAAYSWLLTRCSPVLVATHTYTNPLIAVLLGAVIAGERVTPRIILAAAAVVMAILLVRRDTADPEPRPRLALMEE